MIRDRGWGRDGNSARQADAAALVDRPAQTVPYAEREARDWWRLVAQGRQQGRDTQRTGYIAPGQNVPGATPGDPSKGRKGRSKGGKTMGKRACPEFEADGHASTADQSWHYGGVPSSSTWNPDPWANWRGRSGRSY